MKYTFSSRIGAVALTMWLGLATGTASAVPTLQLGIAGGTYDWSTETVVSTSPIFSLYAFLLPDASNLLSDTYYVSMAITPQVSTPADLGSFTYNGNTVNVTSGMTYGNPPMDASSAYFDPGDLAPHSIFPTYYKEVDFSFASGNKSGVFNTQDHPTWGPQSGSGMYYNLFSMDTSKLAAGYAIHFDLYNTALTQNCTKTTTGMGKYKKTVTTCTNTNDTDITKFAPFSHDAQSMTSPPPVPEPETYAMLLAGLGLIGFTARRRKQNV